MRDVSDPLLWHNLHLLFASLHIPFVAFYGLLGAASLLCIIKFGPIGFIFGLTLELFQYALITASVETGLVMFGVLPGFSWHNSIAILVLVFAAVCILHFRGIRYMDLADLYRSKPANEPNDADTKYSFMKSASGFSAACGLKWRTNHRIVRQGNAARNTERNDLGGPGHSATGFTRDNQLPPT